MAEKLVCIAMKVDFDKYTADVMHRYGIGARFGKYDPNMRLLDAVFLIHPEREEDAVAALNPYIVCQYYRTEKQA